MQSINLNNQPRKNHSRTSMSDFEFLLKSMDRGKENLVENIHLKNNNNSLLNTMNETKIASQRNNNHDAVEFHDLISKIYRFLGIVETLLETCAQGRLLKQAKALSQQIQITLDTFNYQTNLQSSLTTNLTASTNDHQGYVKLISQLQSEKDKLTNLLNQHQTANIKMYIQMNQGQSAEIEKYKRQLASLFQSYKKLQKIILSKNKKVKELEEVCIKYKLQITSQQSQCSNLAQQLQKTKAQLKTYLHKEKQPIKLSSNHIEIKSKPNQQIQQLENIINEQNIELQRSYYQLKKLLDEKNTIQEKEKPHISQTLQKEYKCIIQKLKQQNSLLKKISSDYEHFGMLLAQADAIEELISISN